MSESHCDALGWVALVASMLAWVYYTNAWDWPDAVTYLGGWPVGLVAAILVSSTAKRLAGIESPPDYELSVWCRSSKCYRCDRDDCKCKCHRTAHQVPADSSNWCAGGLCYRCDQEGCRCECHRTAQ